MRRARQRIPPARAWERLWGRWATPPALLALLAVLVAGCAGVARQAPPHIPLAPNQVFHESYPASATDIATMDPQQVQDLYSYGVVQLVFDGLVALDQHLNIEPWGASRWDVSPDGLTYTFHLWPGQAFSNGTPVTSTDYAYAINRTIDPCVASPVSYYLTGTAGELIKDSVTFTSERCADPRAHALALGPGQTIPLITTLLGDSLLTPDEQTLVIQLARPAAYFVQALAYTVADAVDPSVVGPVLSDEAWTDKLSQGPTGRGGSGMYYLAKWGHHAGTIVLKRNPHWWGLRQGKKPYLSEIDFTVFRDTAATYSAYLRGQFDVGFPANTELAQAEAQPGYHAVPALTMHALRMDWRRPPYNNVDLRQALCLAINRDALNQQLYGGSKLPTWHLVPQGMPGYNPTITGPDGVSSTQGDLNAARAHWQAYVRSLHGAAPLRIEFYHFDYSTSDATLGLALAQQWHAVLGIQVAMRTISTGYFWADTSPTIPLGSYNWQADYPDAQDFLTLQFDPTSPYNTGVNLPNGTALDDQADATSDPAQRQALYNQAEQLYVSQVARCPLFQDATRYVLRPWVHGWAVTAQGVPSNDAWIATFIAAH